MEKRRALPKAHKCFFPDGQPRPPHRGHTHITDNKNTAKWRRRLEWFARYLRKNENRRRNKDN